MKHESLHHILSYMSLGTKMMAVNQPCWDYTLISLKKMIENHVNMVPNAWLIRK